MTIEKWASDLSRIVNPENIKCNESLKQYTMTKLGGEADVFVMPETEEEAQSVVKYAYENQVPLLMLGNGSNMVVRDGGVRGIVLNFAKLNDIRIQGDVVVAQAGALIIEVSRQVAANGLTGFEFACGIPGSIGGAMAMNAGAYGGEIKDVIVDCTVLTQEGERLVLSKDELELAYRKSIIAKNGYYVLNAKFQLEKGDQQEIDAKIAELTYLR
ncbi:MAG: FAD-binding protein, partial [Lysinibacillus sp.]